MASNTAKPRTDPLESANRMNAVIKRRYVAVEDRPEALVVAGLDGAAGVLPRLISSLIRSKMTTFASAATPMESTMPAIPGSVTVIGMITMSPQSKNA